MYNKIINLKTKLPKYKILNKYFVKYCGEWKLEYRRDTYENNKYEIQNYLLNTCYYVTIFKY